MKTCLICEQPFTRRENESAVKYAERETCSRRCGAFQREAERAKFKNPDQTGETPSSRLAVCLGGWKVPK